MHDDFNPLIPRAQSWSRGLAFVTTLIGCATLAGWLFHIPWLTGTGHGAPTTVPNTAVCFVLAGLALWALQAEKTGLALIGASLVAFTGFLTSAEYLLALDFGIDRLLFDVPPEPAQTEFPGRMARATSANFLLAGTGLLWQGLRSNGGNMAVQSLAGLVFLSGLFSLIGHLYDASALRDFLPYQSMSLYTTVAFLVLAAGMLASVPQTGFMAVLTSNRSGGLMVRRLLPLVFSISLLLGLLRLEGQRSGLYGTEVGVTLFTVLNLVVIGWLAVWQAARINRIDQRQRAIHTALEEKEEQLSKAQQIAHLGHWDWHIATDTALWSDEFCRIFGLPRERFGDAYRAFCDCVHPEDRQWVREQVDRALQGEDYNIDYRIVLPEGDIRIVHAQAEAVFDETGTAVRMFGTVQDITERVLQEEALKRSEARFHWLFDCNMIGIGFWKADGEILDANAALLELLGYTREDLAKNRLNWRDLTPPEHRHLDQQALQDLAEHGVMSPFEKAYIRKSGRKIPVLVGGATDSGTVDQGVFFVLDLRKYKEAETRARQMAVIAALAEERERKAVARDLHDGLGQILHVAKIKLDDLSCCEEKCERYPQLQTLQELISSASQRVRSLTAQLVPPVLETFGLVPALDWLADEMERVYGLRVEIDDDAVKPLSKPQAAILFRAVRELLINVAKHAGVHEARVVVRSDDTGLSLAVEDHGVGMTGLDAALQAKEGYGLASVADRINYLGGTLEIRAPEQGGTSVILRIPYVSLADAGVRKE